QVVRAGRLRDGAGILLFAVRALARRREPGRAGGGVTVVRDQRDRREVLPARARRRAPLGRSRLRMRRRGAAGSLAGFGFSLVLNLGSSWLGRLPLNPQQSTDAVRKVRPAKKRQASETQYH